MIVVDCKTINEDKWRKLLYDNSFSTPYQTPDFYQFFNKIDNHKAKVYAIEDEASDYTALCVVTIQQERGIKGFFSRRAIIYGGPLIVEGNVGKQALGVLLSAMNKEFKHKVIYAETRNFNDYSNYKDAFLNNDWNYEPYLNFQILLQGKNLEDILGAMKYNRRREILLSLKESAFAKEACTHLERGINKKVNLIELKGIERQQVNLIMNSVDCILLTSFSEGSPQFIKEAMSCNKPIVATNVGDIEWLLSSIPGHFITSFDLEDVAQKIQLALEFSEKYGRTNGRDRIIELGLDSETVAKKIVCVYDSVLKKR